MIIVTVIAYLVLLAARIDYAISSSDSLNSRTEVCLGVDRFVPQFDDSLVLRDEADLTEFDNLGRVQVLANAKKCKLFEACFNLYTKGGEIIDLCTNLGLVRHKMTHKRTAETRELNYHFDLTQVLGDKNHFDPSKRTIIIVPGYTSSKNVAWMHKIKEMWMQLEDVNVIMVHWPEGNRGDYRIAAANTKLLARQIVIFLHYLAESKGSSIKSDEFLNKIYLVGHSLGAHASGFVGKELRGKINRVTGLDPAGPVFNDAPSTDRLDSSDAKFVDVIHTNAGSFGIAKFSYNAIKEGYDRLFAKEKELESTLMKQRNENRAFFGIDRTLGHVDFWPNGGSFQPGCLDHIQECNHKRATWLYAHFLEYEIKARETYKRDSEFIKSKEHRLMAFKGIEYDDFKTATNFHRVCPAILGLGDAQSIQDSDYKATFKDCTMPIDFITPGDVLLDELERSNRLIEERYRPHVKFFFDTNANEPYVAEHLLLKLHLPDDSEDPLVWSKGCKLKAIVRLFGSKERLSFIEYTLDDLNYFQTEHFNGLMIPFANPLDWRDNFPSRDNIKSIVKLDESDEESFKQIRDFYPGTIDMNLVNERKSGRLNRVFKSLTNLVIAGEDPGPTCKIKIRGLEMSSLVNSRSNFSLWYTNDREDDSGKRVKDKSKIKKLDSSLDLTQLEGNLYTLTCFSTVDE